MEPAVERYQRRVDMPHAGEDDRVGLLSGDRLVTEWISVRPNGVLDFLDPASLELALRHEDVSNLHEVVDRGVELPVAVQ